MPVLQHDSLLFWEKEMQHLKQNSLLSGSIPGSLRANIFCVTSQVAHCTLLHIPTFIFHHTNVPKLEPLSVILFYFFGLLYYPRIIGCPRLASFWQYV